MAGSVRERLAHAWNAFIGGKEEIEPYSSVGPTYVSTGYASRRTFYNDNSIIDALYTRIAIDVAAIRLMHVRLDDQDRYAETIKSSLNYCLTQEANIDQTASALRQDIAMTMFDDTTAVVVPVETSLSPNKTGGYDIQTLRVGTVVEWFEEHVRVRLFNQKTGNREEITLPKKMVAMAVNPLHVVMNGRNSILQRIVRKLQLLDAIDEQSGSGKLDMIIQLPYVVKSQARREQAEQRAKDIEVQLKGSQYGIAYTDGTEKITQLNRPVENKLLDQIEFLTNMLHNQLGITPEVFNGTADEKTMINYFNRTVEPIVREIVEAMRRSFLTKTARTQGQSIEYFRDPFALVPVSQLAEIADKFTRNEIMSSNEIRSAIGLVPSKDPKADELRNKNLPEVEPKVEEIEVKKTEEPEEESDNT